ncbi:MAG: hypothetical protein HYZ69_01945 [Candidatus Colwellbacteria bacterium]|nr:hypothetical protein [Candidatus Colwellbacteria bacterium]
MKKYITPIIVILSILAVFLRLLPHMPNFAPIGALALFIGLYSMRKSWSLIPLASMFVSDIFIGFYDFKIMAVVYLSFLAYAAIGRMVRNNKSFLTVVSGTFSAALLFYLTTNFAVWSFGSWYPHTFSGLTSSYEMALPFFRNSLLGDLFYIGIFAGSYELAIKTFPIFLQKTRSILYVRSVI